MSVEYSAVVLAKKGNKTILYNLNTKEKTDIGFKYNRHDYLLFLDNKTALIGSNQEYYIIDIFTGIKLQRLDIEYNISNEVAYLPSKFRVTYTEGEYVMKPDIYYNERLGTKYVAIVYKYTQVMLYEYRNRQLFKLDFNLEEDSFVHSIFAFRDKYLFMRGSDYHDIYNIFKGKLETEENIYHIFQLPGNEFGRYNKKDYKTQFTFYDIQNSKLVKTKEFTLNIEYSKLDLFLTIRNNEDNGYLMFISNYIVNTFDISIRRTYYNEKSGKIMIERVDNSHEWDISTLIKHPRYLGGSKILYQINGEDDIIFDYITGKNTDPNVGNIINIHLISKDGVMLDYNIVNLNTSKRENHKIDEAILAFPYKLNKDIEKMKKIVAKSIGSRLITDRIKKFISQFI